MILNGIFLKALSVVFATLNSESNGIKCQMMDEKRFIVPKLENAQWSQLNNDFALQTIELRHNIGTETIGVKEGIEQFSEMLNNFMGNNPIFQKTKPQFFITNRQQLLMTLEEKNRLWKKAKGFNASNEDRINAHRALRYYNYMLHQEKGEDTIRIELSRKNCSIINFGCLLRKAVMEPSTKRKLDPNLM